MIPAKHPPNLPAGEQLPEYDDEPQVDAYKLHAWLVKNLPDRWSVCTMHGQDECTVAPNERQLIVDVIGALQVVGDATVVKNPTYRALLRDRRDLESLSAVAQALAQEEGDPAGMVEAASNPALYAVQQLGRPKGLVS